uniref:Chromatin remodeling factor mit1 n=1 Tax=Psilocybe cubensis TaxID=181762 RepID=A0A8H7YAC3_PSICU
MSDIRAESTDNFQRKRSPLESLSPLQTSKLVLKMPSTPTAPRTGRVFVSAPRLPSAQKRQYKRTSETSLILGTSRRVDEVIGEYTIGGELYYYARYDGGIAYKFQARTFEEEYPELLVEYRRKQSESKLAPFDPYAQYVHPGSRPRKITVPLNNGSTSTSVRREESEVVPDSEAENDTDTSSKSSDDGDYSETSAQSSYGIKTRQHNRTDLPFSPRKSRSRKIIPVSDSESDENGLGRSVNEVPSGVRRSTRMKKVTKVRLDFDDDEYTDDDGVSERRRSKSHAKAKKNRVKSARPMYGHFRSIESLDQDPFSDDEDNEVLRQHRSICEKCHLAPAHKLLAAFQKKSKGKGKKRKRSTDDEFEQSDSEQTFIDLGGWVQCLKCPVSAHWKCLASNQRDEVLKAVRAKDLQKWEKDHPGEAIPALLKKTQLDIDQTTEFICGSCMRGGICMGCMDIVIHPDPSRLDSTFIPKTSDVAMSDAITQIEDNTVVPTLARELLFRCFTCKRLSHYRHLPKPAVLGDDPTIHEIAGHYQSKSWLCGDCSSYKYNLDKIIAWRPYPANALEPMTKQNETANYKAMLPREYLVKWQGKSYRRLEWVPHMWLVATNPSKLKNFISGGTKIELLQTPVEDINEDSMQVDAPVQNALFESESTASSAKPPKKTIISATSPLPDAEKRIPPSWKLIDRVLDVVLWRPVLKRQIKPFGKKVFRKKVIASEEEASEVDEERERITRLVSEKGEQPPPNLTETLDEWKEHSGKLIETDIDKVAWAFIKWNDLGYEEATWDSPPKIGEKGYDAFQTAFKRFIDSQSVEVPKHSKKYLETFDTRKSDAYKKYWLHDASKLDLGQDSRLKLMPFQVDGFNWLGSNWWNHQHCILADEMGLGKTVQIVSFLGYIAKIMKAFPSLVVVPNSTITNWVREFERWAPNLRVVPFYGEKVARDVLKQYELFHNHTSTDNLKAKFHVLITTYEALVNGKDFTSVFKSQPRWEVLVVDEGQRLKNDNSLLFKKLNELNSIHRIIMTGTPLNNNMRELFNLMNFLDPIEWKDLETLEKQHETLTEDLVKQLHQRLRPYFLRRIKSEVLDLPPKNEVIVPVSMAPLQKEIYRSILSHNLSLLNGLTQPSSGPGSIQKGRINNVLMQLRKCLQHPYLYDEGIEPRNLPAQETHEKLIDGSGKLRFLKALLPKLKSNGHRVLLFSQFVIALDVVEDFLQGEGYKFLRLDGNTKGAVRQKAMDEFNKPDSEYFIFLLTTRAGGVGINLYTADTVIIFDPDFNPHQDLQAIARAYRFGQKKTCLVFKLMVKDSAEERIMQIGKKKLVLDHLIVQKINDDEDNGGEDVQSILTYGAQALFEPEESSRDITYTDNDIDKLLEKTEREAVKEAPKASGGLTFAFAKVWAAEKDALEDIGEEDQTDSWAQTLEKINQNRAKEQEKEAALSGRGARRKAADIAKNKIQVGVGGSESFNNKSKQSPGGSDAGSVYSGSDHQSEIESDIDNEIVDEDFIMNIDPVRQRPKPKVLRPVDDEYPECGLCKQHHGVAECHMVDRSENLAEYREMLILHPDDETWEDRCDAIQAIDEILYQRGHLSLIAGQPLHPLPPGAPPTVLQPRLPLPGRSNAQITPNPSVVKLDTTDFQQAESSKQALAKQDYSKKRQKISTASCCPVCGMGNHLLKDCSIIVAGSKSISENIMKLETRLAKEPSLQSTIDIMLNLLKKAKSRENIESKQ